MTQMIDCPIWGEGFEASSYSQWSTAEIPFYDEAHIDSPRAGGMFRLSEEAFRSIRSSPLKRTQKLKISEWIWLQRKGNTQPPFVTRNVIESVTKASGGTTTPIPVRAQKLLQYLIDQTENIGDQVPIGKYGYEVLIVSESTEWTEIFFLLKELTSQGLIDYTDARNPAQCLPMVTARGYSHIHPPNVVHGEYTMKVFISHSGKDAALARGLVNLIQKAMRLSSDDIRCSSVDGYRLPGGASTDELLRAEIHDAELVVGLITPDSIKSLYVAFELGARWGAHKPMIPLLASGATPEDLTGPLAGINALSCDNYSQVTQLIEETASKLNISVEKISSCTDEINKLTELSSHTFQESQERLAETLEQPDQADIAPMHDKAKELLLEATKNNAGFIGLFSSREGTSVQAGQKTMNTRGNHRSETEWMSALDSLSSDGLVIDHSGNQVRFDVTAKGYEIADELRKHDPPSP